MKPPQAPKLRFLHSEKTMSPVKLEMMRRLSTEALKSSLVPGRLGALKVRPDGEDIYRNYEA